MKSDDKNQCLHVHQMLNLPEDFGVAVESCEVFGTGTEGIHGHHRACVILAGEVALHCARSEVAAMHRHATRLVVGSDDDQCLTVAGRPLEHLTDGMVEVQRLLHQHVELIPVTVVVEL